MASSLREFAKRERANSWQSKGKFAFKFVDCHALLLQSSQWRRNFVILSLLQKGEKSKEFKTRFEFVDTSLSCESSVWQCKEFLDISRYRSVWQGKERSVWQDKSVWQSLTLFCLTQTSIFWYLNAKIHKFYAVLFNRRFVFMDTSLRSVWQGKIRQVSMTKSYAILLKQN